jgi:hypothetical protein
VQRIRNLPSVLFVAFAPLSLWSTSVDATGREATRLAQADAPPTDPASPPEGSTSPDDIAPLDVPPLDVDPMDASTGDAAGALVFKPGPRAADVCPYNAKTESYSCPADALKHFNVRSSVVVTPPATGTPVRASATYDDASGCMLALNIDFGQSSVERRVSWKTSTLVVSGKETDFYVESSNGDVEPGWETGTLIVPNAPMKEALVGRKGKCLIDLLDEESARDSFFVDIQIEEAGSTNKHRVEVERSWVSASVVEAARALPEPTEPLPSSFWPWVVGGLGVCGVGGCCAGPTCLLSAVLGGAGTIIGLGAAMSNSALIGLGGICGLYGGIISLYGILPSAIVGLLIGLGSGAGIGYGLASSMESSFPDDKESDARWLAWRAFRQKNGVPMPGPKLDLPKKPSTAMAH